MANRYAVKSGNWSDTTVWDGGTLPGAGDVVRPNTYTVTIDQGITVDTLRNDASSPAAIGGFFVVGNSSVAINANITNATGSSSSHRFVSCTGAGNVSIVGNISTTSAAYGVTVYFSPSSASDISITGNLSNSATGSLYSCQTVNIAGLARLVSVNGDITGTVNASHTTFAVSSIASSVTINGNVTGGSQGDAVISSSAVLYTGTAKGGSGGGTSSVLSRALVAESATGVITIANGSTLIGGTGSSCIPAVGCTGSASKIVLRNVSVIPGVTKAFPLSGNVYVEEGYAGPVITLPSTTNPNTVNLSRLGSSNPAPTNVRAGTVYADNITGTLAVPAPASVAYGVPTDATTGTATLDLGTVAALVGQQIAAAVSS